MQHKALGGQLGSNPLGDLTVLPILSSWILGVGAPEEKEGGRGKTEDTPLLQTDRHHCI